MKGNDMLQVEIQLAGFRNVETLYTLRAVNRGHVEGTDDDMRVYECTCTDMRTHEQIGEPVETFHHRPQGAIGLAAKLCSLFREEILKTPEDSEPQVPAEPSDLPDC